MTIADRDVPRRAARDLAVGGGDGSSAPGRGARWAISYRASLIISISLLVVCTGLTLSVLAFRRARANTTALAHSLFQEVSDHAVTRTRGYLLRAVPIAESLGNLAGLGLATYDPERLARQLGAVLKANRGVSWVSYSNEDGRFVGTYRTPEGGIRINQSYIFSGKTAMREYDLLPNGSWQLYREEKDSGYDPRKRPFYTAAKEAGKLTWLPPYIFYEQAVPGITCANPLYGPEGKLEGVLTVDFDLNTLSEFVQQLSVSPNSRLFIMTSDGVLLAHPTIRPQVIAGQRDRGRLMHIPEIDDPLVKTFYTQLQPEDVVVQGSGDHARQFDFSYGGQPYFARSTAFSIGGGQAWVVGAMAPQADFLAELERNNKLSLLASVVALVAAVVVAMFLARRVSGPIVSLVSFMNSVGAGDLNRRANLGGAREFRTLSGALDQMLAGLRDRMQLRTALAVAMEVQQKLLPDNAPQIDGLDIAGFSDYCDETGGDYFDYIVVDEQRGSVLVAVGDVMGHGIAAALLMATARAILHSRAPNCGHLGQLLTHLNDLLVDDMTAGRFMTMQLMLVESSGEKICWASAGHDPAIIYDPATDQFEETGMGGIPLGIDAGTQYAEDVHRLVGAGKIIVMATDGVWESTNEAEDFFGKPRLKESIRAAAASSAREIAGSISGDLNRFRGSARQRDDVTVVVMKTGISSRM